MVYYRECLGAGLNAQIPLLSSQELSDRDHFEVPAKYGVKSCEENSHKT